MKDSEVRVISEECLRKQFQVVKPIGDTFSFPKHEFTLRFNCVNTSLTAGDLPQSTLERDAEED